MSGVRMCAICFSYSLWNFLEWHSFLSILQWFSKSNIPYRLRDNVCGPIQTEYSFPKFMVTHSNGLFFSASSIFYLRSLSFCLFIRDCNLYCNSEDNFCNTYHLSEAKWEKSEKREKRPLSVVTSMICVYMVFVINRDYLIRYDIVLYTVYTCLNLHSNKNT